MLILMLMLLAKTDLAQLPVFWIFLIYTTFYFDHIHPNAFIPFFKKIMYKGATNIKM